MVMFIQSSVVDAGVFVPVLLFYEEDWCCTRGVLMSHLDIILWQAFHQSSRPGSWFLLGLGGMVRLVGAILSLGRG
jgi:hypothetical protein